MRTFEEIYDEVWSDHPFTNWSRFEQTVKLIPNLPIGAQVFDIAAGPGRFADYAIENSFLTKDQFVCFEISPSAANRLKALGYQSEALDIEKTPVAHQADLIFFLEAIEHVMEPDRVIKNLYDSLKPGGYLIISTPNYAKINLRIKMALGIIPEVYTTGNHHIALFSVWFLKDRLKYHGFVVDKERDLFVMESMGRIWRKGIKPLFPFLKKWFPLPDYNYVVARFCPNLLSDLVLIRVKKPDANYFSE